MIKKREIRAKILLDKQQEIEKLIPCYEVNRLSDYQFRINGILDLYIVNKKFHNIKTNKRGQYKTVSEIIKQQI